MIKKLDILIIRAFIGPFLATFIISVFVLVMQFMWLYIDDLVGKGLDLITVLRLIGYVAATWVPLALPLSLLLSSIMTFGNLGESFELVAIKSAGIPLLRFMRPLLFASIFISCIAFVLANNIIPAAQLKLNAMKYDIIVAKPALNIKEGVFYDKLEGFVIKLGKKEKDDSTIRNVIIYEKNYALQDRLLVAESGIMRVTPGRFLEFTLRNGWRYEENGRRYDKNTEFIRLGFKEYKKLFDLRSFIRNHTEDSLFKADPKMLSVRQLSGVIDSLGNLKDYFYYKTEKDLSSQFSFLKYKDSAWQKCTVQPINSLDKLIPDDKRSLVYEGSLSKINSAKVSLEVLGNDFVAKSDTLRKHLIEWHRKFALSAACIVLFMIGAPLGSIIRKGGLGTPLVFAIVFFVLFHLINTFGEKLAKQSVTSPLVGMWLSTAILIPIGIFLTVKAMSDSQLFNKEFYYRFIRRLKILISLIPLFRKSITTS